MDFGTFIQKASAPSFWAEEHKIIFKGDTFSPLFFSTLLTQTEKNNLLPYVKTKIDLSVLDKKNLMSTLNQSILGQNSFFWLGNLASITQQETHAYLAAYQGPHILAYFIPSDSKFTAHHKTTTMIDIPENIDLALFNTLITFFSQTLSPQKNTLLKKIFKEVKTLDLDTTCMLINYLELMPAKNSQDFETYLAHISNAQPTLTQLSEHFFSKNPTQFWPVWAKISKDYPDMFWLAFWSEQIWKAYHVVTFLKKNDFINAKKMSFRLPYSFVSQHWKKHSIEELTHLYEYLYNIDRAIKKGSTFFSLDLFYLNYFLGKIKSS